MASFHAFKVATDGTGDKWGHVPGLTLEQARDPTRFPIGRQIEADGRAYVWSYAINASPAAIDAAIWRDIGKPSRPQPSAASLILGKLTHDPTPV